ncbi:hypothetical protein A0H76_2914 [Hepatospora eriocheir]|uniref:Uncharacterized protein n=1 Tax=Hepatospora eriocheir TaxID=1081669 RepID=A0A1X0Q5J9_9MICR|nr:hypothetical protein A0H76_2914 [Hepatospora eriocheir]
MLRSILNILRLSNKTSNPENVFIINETTMTELFKDESFSENYKKLKETAHNFHKKVYNCQNIIDFVYTPHYKFLWKNSEFEDIILTLKEFLSELKSIEKKPQEFLDLLNNTLIEYESFIILYKKFEDEIEKHEFDKTLFFKNNGDYVINNVFKLLFNFVMFFKSVCVNNYFNNYDELFIGLNKEETLSAGIKFAKFFDKKLKERDVVNLANSNFVLDFDCFIGTDNYEKEDVISIIKEITLKFFELSNMSMFLDDLNSKIYKAIIEFYDN